MSQPNENLRKDVYRFLGEPKDPTGVKTPNGTLCPLRPPRLEFQKLRIESSPFSTEKTRNKYGGPPFLRPGPPSPVVSDSI